MSGAGRWRELGDLLVAAALRAPQERASYLSQACPDPTLRRELESLLAVHAEAEGFLDEPAEAWVDFEAHGDAPAAIGRYRLLSELGRGGMGTVYLALLEQAGTAVPVALKVLRNSLRGAQWRRRFETERQALLSLRHAYIAQLLDAGETAEGTPYLVLEYVSGSRLLEHCRACGLGVRERLELFCKVCEAVQHAHQNLVLHRDLKPANVLVDEHGEPKLLDFGLAKLLRSEEGDTITAGELRPLTPGYASPEQLRGEGMTTASDVYALGVMLYELLAGTRPFLKSEERIELLLRAIEGGAQALPAGSGVERDVEAVVRKALRYEAGERYATVLELREDLQRHLSGRPVRARASSRVALLLRFVKRHRVAVALGSALVCVLGAAGANAWRQHARLLQTQARAERVTELLVDVFAAPDPENAQGRTLSAVDVLERGERRLRERLTAEPQTRAALLYTIGAVHHNLGSYDRAAVLLTEALDLRRALHVNDRELAETLERLAEVRFARGEFEPTKSLAAEALALMERAGLGHTRTAIDSLRFLGLAHAQLGQLERGQELLKDALQRQRAAARGPAVETIVALNDLSVVCSYRGADAEAHALLEEAVGIAHALGDPADPQVLTVFGTLAVSLTDRDELPAEALDLQRAALDGLRRLYGERHPYVAMSIANLAHMLTLGGRWDEAEPLARKALALQEEMLGPGHPDSFYALRTLGRARAAHGDLVQAETLLRRAREVNRQRIAGDPGPENEPCSLDLARVVLARGRVADAGALIDVCIARRARRYGPTSWALAEAETVQAEWLAADRRPLEAQATAERAHATLVRELGENHAHTQAAAQLLKRLGALRVAQATELPASRP